MSECVVRMEIPSNCEKCPMCGTESCGNGMYKLWCMCGDIPASSQRRPEDCPIICSLPEGHGRLIDQDSLEIEECSGCINRNHKYINCMDCAIANAPTIVPAEAESPSPKPTDPSPIRGVEYVPIEVDVQTGIVTYELRERSET